MTDLEIEQSANRAMSDAIRLAIEVLSDGLNQFEKIRAGKVCNERRARARGLELAMIVKRMGWRDRVGMEKQCAETVGGLADATTVYRLLEDGSPQMIAVVVEKLKEFSI